MTASLIASPNPASNPTGQHVRAGAPARVSFTRDQLLAIGQSKEPYRFIPLACQALTQIPTDAALRFILATNYARLILRTPAAEQLDRLPPAAQADPSTQALRAVLSQLPDDRVSSASLHVTLQRNLDALASRTDRHRLDLSAHLPAWNAWAAQQDWFAIRVTPTGAPTPPNQPANIIRRPVPNPDAAEPQWGGGGAFLDHRSAALAVPLDFLEPNAAGRRPHVILEGLNPPWLFQRLFRATPDADDGHRVPIFVLQADPLELLTGLALADLSRELADPRVRLFVGPDASTRFRDDLHARIDYASLGAVVTAPSLSEPCDPPLGLVMQEFQATQITHQESLRERVDDLYRDRTPAWYAKRFTDARAGRTEPLRVLVPTCRYSTFVRHSAHDIAEAFRARGCEARILIEPDEFSHFSGSAYFRAYAEFKPDLVVLINYTRTSLGGVTPANVPFVCWVQDPMPHLFDATAGSSQTQLDFLVGHTHRELFTRYRYPRERSLGLPVLVNERKFHPTPVDDELRRRFACEIAYVSNHGQTPEALRDSITNSPGIDAGARRIILALYSVLEEAVTIAHEQPLKPALHTLIKDTARDVLGREPDPILVTRMLNNVAMPLADRLMRHQTLHWAADICKRRSWRLRIFGRGWDKHPRFRAMAQPEINHGEELRACYQAAAIQIHASIHWMFHQRVLECACSGGLPAYRYKIDDLRQHHDFVAESMLRDGIPFTRGDNAPGVRTFQAADHPECLKYVALCQRLGRKPGQMPFTRACHPVQDFIENRHGLPFSPDLPWFLGDPAENCFRSPAELERVVERAIDNPDRRAAISAGIRERVHRHFTYANASTRLIDLVERSLDESAKAPITGA